MNSVKKFKEIKLELKKHSVVLNDAEIKASLIDHLKKELVFKLKNELNFVVNEVGQDYKTYKVSVSFLYVDIPENDEELFDLVTLLIEKYKSK